MYLSAPAEAYIVDEKADKAIKVLKMGFADAVVWNIGEHVISRAPLSCSRTDHAGLEHSCAHSLLPPLRLSLSLRNQIGIRDRIARRVLRVITGVMLYFYLRIFIITWFLAPRT